MWAGAARGLAVWMGLAALLSLWASEARADDLPATVAKYEIAVELEPERRELTGTVDLTWTNPSSRPIAELAVHLYLNAFANEGTTFQREAAPTALHDHTQVLDRYDDPWGWTEILDVAQLGDSEARCAVTPWQPDDANPHDESLVRVALARPVAPGATARFRFRFEARLPVPMARTGGFDDYFFVAQWFPKLAAMDPDGSWRAAQFHRATEFYADFADYDVRIKAPAGWLVAATGSRGDDDGGAVRYRQRAVHDFAFVAGRNLTQTLHEVNGVELRIVAPPGNDSVASRVREALVVGLEVLQSRVGPYPYPSLTVVLPPWRGRRTSGMEYPTLITGFPGDPVFDTWPASAVLLPESVAVHELAHQYFYGVVATDERRDAFLDEGFTTFWEGEILERMQGGRPSLGAPLGRSLDWTALRSRGLRRLRHGEAVAQQPSWMFAPETAIQQIYARTAVTLQTAKARFGAKVLDAVFARYYRENAFAHPTVEDFLDCARAENADLAAFLAEAWTRTDIPDFRVARAVSSTWEAPRGWVRGQEGSRVEQPPGAPALGTDGRAEVRAPGYVRPAAKIQGAVLHKELRSLHAGTPTDGAWMVSEVLVEGPGWDHLPVDVTFEFEDGAVLQDSWDGRAAWRSWRFVRRAALLRATVGPAARLSMDPTPADNALRTKPDRRFVSHWAGFSAALGQWLAMGASLWL
jgi:hypothetical protein